MAKKTNCTINGKKYYKISRKVGMKLNKNGIWVDDRKTFYGASKSEAEEKYDAYMKLISAGKEVSNKCLGELIDEWKDNVFVASELANGTKVKYIAAYENNFRKSRLAGMKATDVTPMNLQKFYNEMDVGYATKRALHNLLRKFYKYADLNGMCRDITGSVTVPGKPEKKDDFSGITVWDDGSLKRLIKALENDRLRLLVVLAVNTGARFAELLALTYDDIRGNMLYINKQLSEIKPLGQKEGTLHMEPTKSSSSNRIVPLSAPVLAEIEKHKEWQKQDMEKNGYETNYLFTTKNGTFYYKRNIRRSLLRTCNREGIDPQSFHSFRHTFGTNLSRSGVQIENTSKLLGHADVTTTARYYVDVDAQRNMDAVERIAEYSLGD